MGIKIPEGIPDSTNLLDGIYTFKVGEHGADRDEHRQARPRVALRVTKGRTAPRRRRV